MRPSNVLPVLVLVLAAGALFAGTLAAESLRLSPEPVRREVAGDSITIELTDAAVEVIFDPAVETAYVEAGLYEGRDGSASLVLGQEGRGIQLRRDEQSGGAAPFWLVLVTPGARRLEVRGARLNLTVAAFPPLAAQTEIELELDASSADLESLSGRLALEGTNAEVGISGLEGALEFDLRDSDLIAQDGGGTVKGQSTGSLVVLDSWRGTVTLGGRETTYEVRSISDRNARLDIAGQGLTVTVSAFLGDLHADLEGGSFTGSGFSGTTVIRARKRAGLDLQDLDRLLELQLAEDSTARVSRMGGRMKVSMDSAFLTADLIHILEITGRGSQINAARVRRMGTANVTDTRLDLDLSTVENHPAILIRGESVAQVRLPTPCAVRLAGRTPDLERRLRVSGCDLQIPGQEGSAKFNENVITLKTSLEGESFLEVTASGARQ